ALDNSPDTIAFALPLLERIAQATAGSERELVDQGLLARSLAMANRQDEAERRMRHVIERARELGQYRLASASASDLLVLLREAGRAHEALQAADAKAEDTRNAGLGPWTQLADEGQRLQLLAELGRYDEVSEAVERLRPQMAALPETSEVEESAQPWNVREGLLDTGRSVALRSKRYEDALQLNDEILRSKQARGASALDLARYRFNDAAPLLRLGRVDDARALLLDCRRVFEAERYRSGLGMVFSLLADLEDETGAPDKAADFERLALGYSYQIGDPDVCAISHYSLAIYLRRSARDPTQVLAHRLAAATLFMQIRSGRLPNALSALAAVDLAPSPPAFADVVRQVETVPGVRLAALFERLPRTFADGDATLAAIWQMALEEKEQRARKAQARQAVLVDMPPAIQAAFELDGAAFSQALNAALQALPADEAARTLQRLREGGLIGGGGGGTEDERIARLLEQFEPMLQGIAAVARGDGRERAELEAVLTDFEGKGFKLVEPVQRIWSGARNEPELVAGLDAIDARLVARVLEILSRQTDA
ncbi:hypothetical protein, partial [Variovorax sp. JS1663]|uniref:hypothetical protein n=1 Tax=Variovorax sp. JS1663 TaxID=1851577 RepID=UPI00192D150F